MKRGTSFFVFLVLISINLISASDVLVWQGQYYTGTTFNTGTYEFNFSVYDNLTGGNVCYSNITILETGNWGDWKTEQIGVNSACNNISKDYFLNINIGGVDQTPRRRLVVWNSLRKDTNEVTTGSLILHGTLQGLSPLKLQDEINFLKSDGTVTSAIYNAPRELTSALPSAFADSLVHDIIEETNDYGMQECFWDENTRTMQMCINGAYLTGRATTISRSLQIVGNITNKQINENFTLCERNNYIDCETDVTGADLLVQDDIEAIGSIFSQENITANYFIGDGSLLTGISSSSTNLTSYALKNQSEIFTGNITTTQTGFFGWLGSLTSRITKLWVQDIDISGNLTGITKEVFFQVDPTDANFGDFRTRSTASGGIWRYNFQVPSDFSSLTSLDIILIPVGTNAAAPVDLYSDYGGIGEAYNIHSESLSTTWNLGTANNIYAMNLSGVFINLGAGDFCGVQVDEGAFGFATHYLGIRLKYKT